ncbi:MAG: AAA family ATPase [Mycobacterium sp.]
MYVDVAAVLEGGAIAPEPDIMPLTEDSFLFYRGEFNLVFGDSESGKTWLTLAAIADVLNQQNGRAAFVDLDHNGPASIVGRLREFGVPDEVLADQQRFRLTQDDGIVLREVVQDLTVFRPDILVLDSLGEALGLSRLDSNNAEDFTQAHTSIIKPLITAGVGVLVVDHLAKNSDSRTFGPTGTTAKVRAVGGAAVLVSAAQPFKPGEGGSAKLQLFKDRHGGVRKQFPRDGQKPVLGTFILTDDGDGLTYNIDPGLTVPMKRQGALDAKRAKTDAAKLEELLAGTDLPLSVRSVRSVLQCGQQRAQAAIDALKAERIPMRTQAENDQLPA